MPDGLGRSLRIDRRRALISACSLVGDIHRPLGALRTNDLMDGISRFDLAIVYKVLSSDQLILRHGIIEIFHDGFAIEILPKDDFSRVLRPLAPSSVS